MFLYTFLYTNKGIFQADEPIMPVEEKSTLTAWYALNRQDTTAHEYLYHEMPEHYTYTKAHGWKRRKRLPVKFLGFKYFHWFHWIFGFSKLLSPKTYCKRKWCASNRTTATGKSQRCKPLLSPTSVAGDSRSNIRWLSAHRFMISICHFIFETQLIYSWGHHIWHISRSCDSPRHCCERQWISPRHARLRPSSSSTSRPCSIHQHTHRSRPLRWSWPFQWIHTGLLHCKFIL